MVTKMNEKYRHELKYICRKSELSILQHKICHILKSDNYADNNGTYVIRSVYFDDLKHKCFYENENGIDPRHKFRIRIYNNSDNHIFLEKKKKINGMTGKESYMISKHICEEMLSGENLLKYAGQNRLLDEWIMERNCNLLKPIMLVEYVRIPYVYIPGNVRITFDLNISASNQIKNFFDRNISKILIQHTGYYVLEVKYDDFLPDIIYHALDMGHMQQTSFSKFYLGCRALEGRLSHVI